MMKTQETRWMNRSMEKREMGMSVPSAAWAAFMALTVVLSFGAVILVSPAAKAAAEGEKALWVGGAGGFFVPAESRASGREQYGVTAGAKIGTEMGLGAYYLTSKKDEGGTLGRFNLDFYGLEGSYHFEGEAKGAYFGLRLGITKIDFGVPGTQVSVSPFHAGVFAGYNHWLGESVSLGADVGFYSVSKGEATALNGTTVSVDSFSALNFLATLKFWL